MGNGPGSAQKAKEGEGAADATKTAVSDSAKNAAGTGAKQTGEKKSRIPTIRRLGRGAKSLVAAKVNLHVADGLPANASPTLKRFCQLVARGVENINEQQKIGVMQTLYNLVRSKRLDGNAVAALNMILLKNFASGDTQGELETAINGAAKAERKALVHLRNHIMQFAEEVARQQAQALSEKPLRSQILEQGASGVIGKMHVDSRQLKITADEGMRIAGAIAHESNRGAREAVEEVIQRTGAVVTRGRQGHTVTVSIADNLKVPFIREMHKRDVRIVNMINEMNNAESELTALLAKTMPKKGAGSAALAHETTEALEAFNDALLRQLRENPARYLDEKGVVKLELLIKEASNNATFRENLHKAIKVAAERANAANAEEIARKIMQALTSNEDAYKGLPHYTQRIRQWLSTALSGPLKTELSALQRTLEQQVLTVNPSLQQRAGGAAEAVTKTAKPASVASAIADYLDLAARHALETKVPVSAVQEAAENDAGRFVRRVAMPTKEGVKEALEGIKKGAKKGAVFLDPRLRRWKADFEMSAPGYRKKGTAKSLLRIAAYFAILYGVYKIEEGIRDAYWVKPKRMQSEAIINAASQRLRPYMDSIASNDENRTFLFKYGDAIGLLSSFIMAPAGAVALPVSESQLARYFEMRTKPVINKARINEFVAILRTEYLWAEKLAKDYPANYDLNGAVNECAVLRGLSGEQETKKRKELVKRHGEVLVKLIASKKYDAKAVESAMLIMRDPLRAFNEKAKQLLRSSEGYLLKASKNDGMILIEQVGLYYGWNKKQIKYLQDNPALFRIMFIALAEGVLIPSKATEFLTAMQNKNTNASLAKRIMEQRKTQPNESIQQAIAQLADKDYAKYAYASPVASHSVLRYAELWANEDPNQTTKTDNTKRVEALRKRYNTDKRAAQRLNAFEVSGWTSYVNPVGFAELVASGTISTLDHAKKLGYVGKSLYYELGIRRYGVVAWIEDRQLGAWFDRYGAHLKNPQETIEKMMKMPAIVGERTGENLGDRIKEWAKASGQWIEKAKETRMQTWKAGRGLIPLVKLEIREKPLGDEGNKSGVKAPKAELKKFVTESLADPEKGAQARETLKAELQGYLDELAKKAKGIKDKAKENKITDAKIEEHITAVVDSTIARGIGTTMSEGSAGIIPYLVEIQNNGKNSKKAYETLAKMGLTIIFVPETVEGKMVTKQYLVVTNEKALIKAMGAESDRIAAEEAKKSK